MNAATATPQAAIHRRMVMIFPFGNLYVSMSTSRVMKEPVRRLAAVSGAVDGGGRPAEAF